MNKKGGEKIYLLSAWLILAAVIWIALSLGAVRVSTEKLFHILFQTSENIEAEKLIIMKIRLPRIILAALTGISLTLGGTVFQALFKNPMAEPYILGISSGSALGASLMALTGINISLLGISALGLGAFGGAGLSLLMLYFFILSSGRNNHISLLLGGVVLSFFFSSLLSLILSMDRELAASILFWTMGSFTTAGWEKIIFLAPLLLIGGTLILRNINALNLLTAGEDTAHTLGIDVNRTRNILLITSSLLTAATVACSGTIGFVGLLVPHGIRLITGANHRRLIPLSLPTGASLMILTDLLARSIHPPMEIPVGVITGLLGAPLFLILLKRNSVYRLGSS